MVYNVYYIYSYTYTNTCTHTYIYIYMQRINYYKVIVIDARDHIMGRLAAIVAKELLQGQKVVVTRCESIVVTGSMLRKKQAFHRFLNKRCNVKPSHGPFHFRAPSRIFWRAVRGMMPHKVCFYFIS